MDRLGVGASPPARSRALVRPPRPHRADGPVAWGHVALASGLYPETLGHPGAARPSGGALSHLRPQSSPH
eukprot:15199645-Alexandrium_andersonii.AAC.1